VSTLETMPGHTRLYRRGATYYHRAAIPKDIAKTYPKSEETFSLRTKDYREALRLQHLHQSGDQTSPKALDDCGATSRPCRWVLGNPCGLLSVVRLEGDGGEVGAHGGGVRRQLIDPFIARNASVAGDVGEGDRPGCLEGVQGLPEVAVLHGLLVGVLPALGLPSFQPFGRAFGDIGAVCEQGDGGAGRDHFQGVDSGQQLRTIVGDVGQKPSGFCSGAIRVVDEVSPGSRAGVAMACAIGVDRVGVFRQGGWDRGVHVGSSKCLFGEERNALLC